MPICDLHIHTETNSERIVHFFWVISLAVNHVLRKRTRFVLPASVATDAAGKYRGYRCWMPPRVGFSVMILCLLLVFWFWYYALVCFSLSVFPPSLPHLSFCPPHSSHLLLISSLVSLYSVFYLPALLVSSFHDVLGIPGLSFLVSPFW